MTDTKVDTKVMDKINPIKVTLTLDNGTIMIGEVNIIDYNRFSDFIDNHSSEYLRFFNARTKSSIGSGIKRFVLIPKAKILFYEPYEKAGV